MNTFFKCLTSKKNKYDFTTIGLQEPDFKNKIFIKVKNFFLKFYLKKKWCTNELEFNKEKFAVNSAKKFPTESILRPLDFTETFASVGVNVLTKIFISSYELHNVREFP